jgi:hypothetical protein
VKLTFHFQLARRSRSVELYLHSHMSSWYSVQLIKHGDNCAVTLPSLRCQHYSRITHDVLWCDSQKHGHVRREWGEEKLISVTEYLRMLSVWRLQTVIKRVLKKEICQDIELARDGVQQ